MSGNTRGSKGSKGNQFLSTQQQHGLFVNTIVQPLAVLSNNGRVGASVVISHEAMLLARDTVAWDFRCG